MSFKWREKAWCAVRVLCDESVPRQLTDMLSGHHVSTVQGMGWAGLEDGEILRRAGGNIDAFITWAPNLEREQNLAALSFGVVQIVVRPGRFDLNRLALELGMALNRVSPGRLVRVSG